jgi:hypothetical protein
MVEVTHLSHHGFWLLLDGDEELPLPFEYFPWFRSATVEQITKVERPSPGHLVWLRLDVDLSVESIRQPENFPLVSRAWECLLGPSVRGPMRLPPQTVHGARTTRRGK